MNPLMIEIVIVGIVCLALGAFVAWLLSSSRSKASIAVAEARVQEVREQLATAREDFSTLRTKLEQTETIKVAAETRSAEIEKHFAEQKALLEDAKAKLSDTFKSLAAEALAKNNTGFLTLAEEKFKALKNDTQADLDARKQAIEVLVEPLSEALSTYQKESKALEAKRLQELGTVGEQLRSLAVAQTTLQQETAKLVNALKSPQVRGRWGEIALRRTAELAGMSAHCDFVEQESVTTEGGRLRPDMIVKLPAGRQVVVDSKVSLEGFIQALEAKTDPEREAALVRHAAQISQHVAKLAQKEYWDQFSSTPEFVVLFIPNDSFLAAAAEKDPTLIESAIAKKVVIATPTTFIALLLAIAYGWRQEQIAENAQRISTLGQELSDRMGTFVEHLLKVGAGLSTAVDSYNAAVSSFESRLLPSARRFKELGAGGKREIDELQSVDQIPRQITAPDAGEAEQG